MDEFNTCDECDSVANPSEILYSDVMDCCCQWFLCPECGYEFYEVIE